MNKHRYTLRQVLILMMIICLSICMGACSGAGDSDSAEEESAEVMNPLTGATEEDGYDPAAADRRIAAFVVENSPEARPQWGMDDPEYSPDIVLHGEVEAGITRTLWLYADYNKLPEIIGPMRSARPPYIRFSELFDAVFIHWGMSNTKGNYLGADSVFEDDEVDHIDQMTFPDNTGMYDREGTRNVSMEHTGIVYGSKVPEALKEAGFREEPEDYTHLDFSELAWLVSVFPAEQVQVTFSDRAAWDRTTWTYNSEDKKYHTANFQNDFARDNLLILFDETEYIDKDNYGGGGAPLTYCDYALGGGSGYLMSQGTVKDIEWRVEDGKLVLIDVQATKIAQERAAEAAESEEAEADSDSDEKEEEGPIEVRAHLFPGKTWIGWASSNNGGKVEITGSESESTESESAETEE